MQQMPFCRAGTIKHLLQSLLQALLIRDSHIFLQSIASDPYHCLVHAALHQQ